MNKNILFTNNSEKIWERFYIKKRPSLNEKAAAIRLQLFYRLYALLNFIFMSSGFPK